MRDTVYFTLPNIVYQQIIKLSFFLSDEVKKLC